MNRNRALVIVFLLGGVTFLGISLISLHRPIKNLQGFYMGYGGCPNCGDCWSWKENGALCYMDIDSEEYCVMGAGVMICQECLNNPDYLNAEKIKQDLMKYDWEPDKAEEAKKAVLLYKEDRIMSSDEYFAWAWKDITQKLEISEIEIK